MQKNILILGAGFGGIRAALDLAKRLGKEARITIVDKNPFHSYTPDYYEAAAAVFASDRAENAASFRSLEATIAIPLNKILGHFKNIRVVVGEVDGMDLAGKSVVLGSGETLTYDILIVALGSASARPNIPHLSERAYDFKSVHDALNVRDAIDEAMYRVPKHEKVRVVIAGGGFTGVELAGELVGFMRAEAAKHSRPRDSFEVTILESGKSILGGAGEWAARKAEKRLRELGVRIMTAAKIVSVTNNAALLADGDPVPYDVLIWTAGVRANSVLEKIFGSKAADKGCLATDDHLRILGNENVYVIGDAAHCTDPETGAPIPMTAQTAIHQGEYVAYIISRMLAGRRTFSYIPIKTRFIIPLGGRYALFNGVFVKFAGLIPWLMKQFIAWNYLSGILPWHKALLLRRKAVKIYLRNDE